jgi:hypothetical protein
MYGEIKQVLDQEPLKPRKNDGTKTLGMKST